MPFLLPVATSPFLTQALAFTSHIPPPHPAFPKSAISPFQGLCSFLIQQNGNPYSFLPNKPCFPMLLNLCLGSFPCLEYNCNFFPPSILCLSFKTFLCLHVCILWSLLWGLSHSFLLAPLELHLKVFLLQSS